MVRAFLLILLFSTGICGCAEKRETYIEVVETRTDNRMDTRATENELQTRAIPENSNGPEDGAGPESTSEIEETEKSGDSTDTGSDEIFNEEKMETILTGLSLEEKVAQMFFITPEALTDVSPVTIAGEITAASYKEYPVGGIILFEQNIESKEQLTDMLDGLKAISLERVQIPVFTAVDEEGGSVTRVYGSGIEGIQQVPDMLSVGATGNTENAYTAGQTLGNYLAALGFNVDFAPVADIFSNPSATVISSRSFGTDADKVSDMVAACVAGLKEKGIAATLKHFPGHGDASGDSHMGYVCSYKTLGELREFEFLPFQAGIGAGADFVMTGHISLPNVLGDSTPASLSYTMTTELLREELGFEGIIITDALNMGAIAYNYNSADAAVNAILAGADMVLMPADFKSAYAGVLEAVQNGRISEERIDESVSRILEKKQELFGDVGGTIVADMAGAGNTAPETSAEHGDADLKISIGSMDAGTIVDASELDTDSLEQYFLSTEISDPVWNRIYGKSYRDNPDIARADLRYLKLLHYNFSHEIQVGELIVNANIADTCCEIFRKLFEAEYEICSMYLVDNYWTGDPDSTDSASIDVNNTSAFNYRLATNSGSLSRHALGYAIDINPQQNPYVIYYADGSVWYAHENAAAYIDRTAGDAHVITHNDYCYQLFTEYGFSWGGDWSSPVDYQHFEMN